MILSTAKKSLLSVLVLTGCATFATAEDSNLKSLPIEARQSLAKWNFKFKPFAETDFVPEVIDLFEKSSASEKPMMLTLDLNNDKIQDFVLLGAAEKQQVVVALVSDKKIFKAVVVDTWSESDFKNQSVPGSNSKREGIIVYLAIPGQEDDVAIGLRKKVNTEIFDIESYMGPSKVFSVKDFRANQLNK